MSKSKCDIDRWPLCCKAHRQEVDAEMKQQALDDGPTGERCHWMVEVASGNPEPDSIEDTVMIVDCGAPLTRFVRNGSAGWECESGHDGWEYGSPEAEYQMMEEEFNDRYYG